MAENRVELEYGARVDRPGMDTAERETVDRARRAGRRAGEEAARAARESGATAAPVAGVQPDDARARQWAEIERRAIAEVRGQIVTLGREVVGLQRGFDSVSARNFGDEAVREARRAEAALFQTRQALVSLNRELDHPAPDRYLEEVQADVDATRSKLRQLEQDQTRVRFGAGAQGGQVSGFGSRRGLSFNLGAREEAAEEARAVADITAQIRSLRAEVGTLEKGFDRIDARHFGDSTVREGRRAEAALFQTRQTLVRLERELASPAPDRFFEEIQADVDRTRAKIQALEREQLRLRFGSGATAPNITGGAMRGGFGAGVGNRAVSDLLIAGGMAGVPGLATIGFAATPLGAAAGLGIGLGVGAYQYGSEAVDNARDLENANRVLAASTREAGIEFARASEFSADFSEALNVTERSGARATAAVSLLLKQAGRTEDLEKFGAAFADLAAARGIAAEDIPAIMRQLITLQDEATDKLLGANPSAFYAEYAAGIGKTAGALNDMEKRAAVVDAIIKRGALFSGEAADRLATTSGQITKLANEWDNLKTSIGEVILDSPQLRDTLQLAGYVVEQINAGTGRRSVRQGEYFDANQVGAEAAVASVTSLYGNLQQSLNLHTNYHLDVATRAREAQLAENRKVLRDQAEGAKQLGTTWGDVANSIGVAADEQGKWSSESIKAVGDEIKRRLELNEVIKTAAQLELERRTKALQTSVDNPDITARGAFAARREFDAIRAQLEAGSQEEKNAAEALADRTAGVVRRFATAALAEVEKLRKDVRGFGAEMTALRLPTEQDNPFVRLFSEAELAAQRAQERFALLGDEAVDAYTKAQRAALEAAGYDLRVKDAMSAVRLEHEAAELARPFEELTGAMKRTLSVFEAELAAATRAPGFQQSAELVRLRNQNRFGFSGNPLELARRGFTYDPRAGFGVNEDFAAGREFRSLLDLRSRYGGVEGLAGEQIRNQINERLGGLYEKLSPAALRQVANNPFFTDTFAGAYSDRAEFERRQVELAARRAENSQGAVRLAERQLEELSRLGAGEGANRDRTRAEFLAVTGALPREELTPELEAARIESLREEASFVRAREQRADEAHKATLEFQRQLIGEGGDGGRLGRIEAAIKGRNESVIVEVLDRSDRATVSTLGGGFQ